MQSNDEPSEKKEMEKALLNILEDYSAEKQYEQNNQIALWNILEDFENQTWSLENVERAMLNILDDYVDEKRKTEKLDVNLILANKELDQFTYMTAHDLKEPLRTITNFTTLLNRKYCGKWDQEAGEYVQLILSATSKMIHLIDDLLLLSRTGRGMSIQSVDCNVVLQEAISNLDASIKASDAKITSAVLPVLMGNQTELRQLFMNLISNAIKFHKKDMRPEIEITVKDTPVEYIFTVKDHGLGIAKDFVDKLFVSFQRYYSDSEYFGSGIGLAICKKIVALNKGKIWVETKEGEGSAFNFSISKQIEVVGYTERDSKFGFGTA